VTRADGEHAVESVGGGTDCVSSPHDRAERLRPGTWHAAPRARPALHIDAAAHAALLALSCEEAVVYNVADDDGAVSIAKARSKLGFDPQFRLDCDIFC
jgi:hypothetical protein